MTDDLTKAIAELRRDGPVDEPWTASLVADGNPYQSSLAGAVATTLNAPLSPARVEAMARELCRIKGLDADGPHAIWSWPNAKDPDLLKQCREFIAMQLAYERTKG